MVATPITPITKFTSRGRSKTYWVEVIADKAAPTRAELDDGIDLTPQLMDASGWSVTSAQIETPNADTRYTETIPGVISAEESTITMYADTVGADARDIMPRDEVGFIVRLDGGDIEGNKCRVFPVTVSSVAVITSLNGGEADTLVFTYAITGEPAEGVDVPAEAA